MALRRRYEMGSALAAYAVREGELRIAVANQYPDLQLTPGWAWDQGLNRWILGLALPQLLLNRNKGPIAEAVARRAMEGSNVEAVQQLILAEVDAAVADCAASRATLDAAAALMEALHVRERSVRAAFDRGEVTQFEGLSLALALAEAEAELQRATLTRIVLGSQLSRVTGLWSRSTSDSLADPLSWPAASAIVRSRARRRNAIRRVRWLYTPRRGSWAGSQRRATRMSSVVMTSTVSWVSARSGAENQMNVTLVMAPVTPASISAARR